MKLSPAFRSFTSLAVLVLSALFLAPPSCLAHKRDFVWTYEWFTPAKIEREIEFVATSKPESHQTQAQVEFEFGVTERWVVAPYFVHETEKGEPAMNGVKLEQRYRFGDFKRYRLLPSAYLELKKMAREDYEGEAKGIVSYVGRNFNFAANLIVSKKLVAGAKKDAAYAAGWSTRLSNDIIGGVEVFGGLNEANPAAGPTFCFDLSGSQRINLGVAFGLNEKAQDLSARVIYEYEWFN